MASVGLFCLTDRGVPAQTTRALEAAATACGVPFYPLHAGEVRAEQVAPLPPGSLLYRPATSTRAVLLEERLWQPGVATVFEGPLGPLAPVVAPTAALLLAGVPIPRTLVPNADTLDRLGAVVDALGGLPVVVRYPGLSGGRGIVRADSLPSLASLLEHAQSTGVTPELVAYVAEATPWRVVVVGDQAVAATRGVIPQDDFRSRESDAAIDYLEEVPEALAAPAIATAAALRVRAAGVDLLAPADGDPVVLEANTPFYFGHFEAQGIRIAAALLRCLRDVVG